jgi:glycosyltransferase involved in cell wall biosynthesis
MAAEQDPASHSLPQPWEPELYNCVTASWGDSIRSTIPRGAKGELCRRLWSVRAREPSCPISAAISSMSLFGASFPLVAHYRLSDERLTFMKLLMVSPVPTDPVIAGNRARVLGLLALLARLGHDVSFAYVPYYEHADNDAMRNRLGERLRVLEADVPPFPTFSGRVKRKLARGLRSTSAHLWDVDEWFDDRLLSQLAALQKVEQFDSVLIEYVFLSKLVHAFPERTRTIIDTHDLMGDRHKLYVKAGVPPTWFATSPQQEIKALNRADAVIAIQQHEEEYLKNKISAEVFCVGHIGGLDIQPMSDPGGTRILFVGSDNPINLHALQWFTDTVLPDIKRKIPSCHLALAGPICYQRSWPAGTVILGTLSDLAPAYAEATLVINPVLFGTGLAIKTVEALTYGRPLVATPAGLRGLGSEFAGAVSVAEGAEDFAEKVIELLKSQEARTRLTQNATSVLRQWRCRQVANLEAAVAGR